MKTTFKISALVLAFTGLTLGAKAQTATTTTAKTSSSSNGVILSIGVDAGIPTGSLSDFYNFNIGGSVQADIPVAQNLFVTVNAGYNSIQGKNSVSVITPNGIATADVTNIQLLPVKAGLKYFVAPHLYVQGEAGAAFALNKSDLGFDHSATFVYSPQVGYQFALSGKSYLDAGVRYETSTNFVNGADESKVNFFGLRVAYAFGL